MSITALRFPGGKAKAIKLLLPYFPNISNYLEFREPFCGGLSFSLFYKTHINTRFRASDLNYELYCFWNQLKHNYNDFITIISFIKENIVDGKALYVDILSRRNSNMSEFNRAIDFYLINRISFSGLADSGGYSQEAFEKRFTKSTISKLYNVAQLIQDIEFYCEDYSYLLNDPGEKVFIYADPPYYTQTNSRLYGKNGDLHLKFDHNRFYKEFAQTKHHTLITYDDCDYVRDMYKQFNIKSVELQYSMNNVNSKTCKKGNELIITNF